MTYNKNPLYLAYLITNASSVIWIQWFIIIFNSSLPSAVYMRQWIGSAFVQIIACRQLVANPLSKPTLWYCQLDR